MRLVACFGLPMFYFVMRAISLLPCYCTRLRRLLTRSLNDSQQPWLTLGTTSHSTSTCRQRLPQHRGMPAHLKAFLTSQGTVSPIGFHQLKETETMTAFTRITKWIPAKKPSLF